jgi:thiol-disulfide isomerase/thioredoxin
MYKNYSELGTQISENKDMYSVMELSSSENKRNIIQNNRLVCVDIYADWCGPCKVISPDYSVLADMYNKNGTCLLVKEKLDLKLTQDVGSIPLFLFYLDGRKVDEVVGGDLNSVEEKLKKYLQYLNNNSSGPIYDTVTGSNQGPQYGRNSIRNYKGDSERSEWQNNNNVNSKPSYWG